MSPKHLKAFEALKALGCPVFEREDHPTGFFISGEEGGTDGAWWIDYYQQFDDPRIEPILRKHGLFAEWENPACQMVHFI